MIACGAELIGHSFQIILDPYNNFKLIRALPLPPRLLSLTYQEIGLLLIPIKPLKYSVLLITNA
jgi:hypothetical protein